MSKLYADLVQMTSNTVGDDVLSIDLSEYSGWGQIHEHFAIGDRFYYMLECNENKEVGLGTLTAANWMDRTTVLGTVVVGRVPAWIPNGNRIPLIWTSIVRVVAPSALFDTFGTIAYSLIAASGPVLPGHSYGVVANNLVLTPPANPAANDRIEFLQAALNVSGTVIDPGTNNINGTPGAMQVDIANFAFGLVFNAGYGWKVTQ